VKRALILILVVVAVLAFASAAGAQSNGGISPLSFGG